MGGTSDGSGGGGRSDGPSRSRPQNIQAKKDKARQEQARIEQGLSTADAYRQISERRASATGGGIKVGNITIPTTAGIIGGVVARSNLNRIESVLKGGGTAVYTKSGRLMGATDQYGRYSGRPEGDPRAFGDLVYGQKDPRSQYDNEGAAPNSGATLVSEDLKQAAKSETLMTKGRKRTRGKRAGQAGTFGEGVLVRNTQK
jgi:hypothetical protein